MEREPLRLPNLQGSPLVAIPWPEPETQVALQPDTTTFIPGEETLRSPGHPEDRVRPPKRRRKEIKVRMQGIVRGMWHAINFLTETFDFVDVLYEALPKYVREEAKARKRKPKLTPDEKAQAIWDHLDEIDVALAIENYINNAMEDYLFGKTSPDRQLNQLTGKPTGGGAGFGTRTHTGQQFGEAVNELVPVLEFDWASGSWRLSTAFGFVGMDGGGRVESGR